VTLSFGVLNQRCQAIALDAVAPDAVALDAVALGTVAPGGDCPDPVRLDRMAGVGVNGNPPTQSLVVPRVVVPQLVVQGLLFGDTAMPTPVSAPTL
jgi:hypothetical protein